MQSAGLARENYGIVKNAYSLISFRFNENNSSNTVGDIVYSNGSGALVENVYSVGDDIGRTNYTLGPTVYSNSGIVNNAYYFSDKIYNNTTNEKITMLALKDIEFQNSVLNDENAFDVNSTVSKGYYPWLNIPECMPKQDYITLPEVADNDLVDILSTEIIEREADTVKVKFTIHNPNAETITNINIENLNCTILNQEYSDSKSYVTAILNNPILYVSDYSVISISSKGAYNKEYTREFQNNERVIKIEFFKKIISIDDWKDINRYPNENYQLENDLDFKNEINFKITRTYTGILNGNGHEIKNINTDSSLFNAVNGEIRNLVINNIQISATSSNVGVINKLTAGKIDKVHIKNINIEMQENTSNQDVYIGGIIANAENSEVSNSSVLNLSIRNSVELTSNSTGAIMGVASNTRIYNCWVQNIDYEIENVLTSDGIGGIVGKFMNNGELQNCYSEGKIVTTSSNVGGIVGSILNKNIIVHNTYSLVNIESGGEYIGGIVGITSGGYNIYNNIAIGNLYATQTTNYIGRINGDTQSFSNNYAYIDQLINGYKVSGTNSNVLSRNELLDSSIYINRVGFGNDFNYDELKYGVLPKLMNSDKNKLLEYQEDIKLEDDSENLSVEEISYQKDINKVSIRLTIAGNITVKKVTITNMEANIINQISRDNNTYLELEAVPIKYLDSYKISTITYEKDNEVKESELSLKLNVSFYKEIYTYEDWQNIDENSYENYMLMQDIDFNGKTNIKYNLRINRLISEGKSLKNINLTSKQAYFGFIKQIKGELSGIIFDNIIITSSASGSYVGIVLFSNATISNIEFRNISLDAKNIGFVAPICSSLNQIENVKIYDIEILGKNYVGGLVSEINQVGTINQVEGSTININAGTYVGGILGSSQKSSIAVDNIHLDNVDISAESYVGGITGTSSIQNSDIENSNITGTSYVGGITGDLYRRENGENQAKLIVDNCTISGTNENIGGITGHLDSTVNVTGIVKNSNIEGLTTKSNNVGGIVGYAQYRMRYNVLINTEIISKGSNVGGISGYHSKEGILYSIFKDGKIEGYSNVGGIVGKKAGNIQFHNNYVSSDIIATNSNAGGIIGNLPNTDMTTTYNNSYIYSNYFANGKIYAPINVGGIIGKIEEELYMPDKFYYRNYIEADISSEDPSYASLGIGSMPNQNQYLADTYFYKYSTINGENPNEQNEIFISSDKYLVESDLKLQATYTSKLKWNTTDWDYGILQDNKYPIIKTSIFEEQEGIDLPIDSEHMVENIENEVDTQSENTNEQAEQTFEYSDKTIETYSTYSVIIAEDGSQVTRNTKLYVKDNNLYAIPVVLASTTEGEDITPVADNIIVDSYNGKEYETVLGSDGRMYDLKEPIAYPENFVNENIESIGNNLNSDSHEVEVIYQNGDKVKFNYQTGDIISSSESNNSDGIGLFEYITDKISEIGNSRSNVTEEISNKYEASKELQTKLEETSVEEAIEKQNSSSSNVINSEDGITVTDNNVTNNSLNENKYISIYNEETGEYEIYNEEELLDTSKEEVVSENEKIEANNLSKYYASEGETRNTKLGIVWIVISIIGVGIILFVLKKNLKKRA